MHSKTTPRCRFELFVSLKPDQVQRYPNNQLSWCHRGDKYSTNEDQMLCNLVRMFLKHYTNWRLCELYDNDKGPKFSQERIVLKMCNGVIEINKLTDYMPQLYKLILPSWLH